MRRILVWETPNFRCQIAGDPAEIPPFLSLSTATLRAEAGSLFVDGYPELSPRGSDVGPALFLEEQTYRVSIQWRGTRQQVQLSGYHVLESVAFDDSDRSEFQFNLQSSVGFASLCIGSAPNLLVFEVLPRKIEYRQDYVSLKQDVNNQAHALAYQALAKTSEIVGPLKGSLPLEAETYAIAQSVLSELLRLLDRLEDQPNRTLVSTDRLTRLAKARKLTPQNWRKVARLGLADDRKLYLLQSLEASVDSRENRFVKWVLMRTANRLSTLRGQVLITGREAPTAATMLFVSRLDEMKRSIQMRIRQGFLQEVLPRTSVAAGLSLVFQHHPIYKRIYGLCIVLLAGLELEGAALQMGIKDISSLYEYWSFLMVVMLIGKHALLESQNLIRIQKNKANLTLVKGRKSTVMFRSRSGRPIEVIYNLSIIPRYTTPQKPDAVIDINNGEARLILDAKYRLQFDPEYVQRYGSPGPKDEDINKMHRYRDAVIFLSGGTMARAKEAVALFPLPASVPFAGTALHRSLDTVGVGGLPCSPGNLGALEEYLISRLAL